MEKNKDFISVLLNRMKIEFQKGDRSGVYGYTQRALAYNSNRIEGSTLTVEQTATLFDTQTIAANGEIIRSKDIEEMTGHFLMFNYMLKTLEEPLSEDLIKEFHYHLKVGVFEDMANGYPCGEYKNRRNMVSDIEVANPNDVPVRMKELLDEYNGREERDLKNLAVFHADYEMIHPFQDGNGRTGRLILFRECLKNDIVPIIIRSENKPQYQAALHTLQTKGEAKDFLLYLSEEQQSYYNMVADMIYPSYDAGIRKRR